MTTFKVVIFMLCLIALSKHFTTIPWVLNYICFMYIAVQLIVANNRHRQILGYNRRDSMSSMFANNAIDTFDALLRKNIYGLKKLIFNIKNDLIRVMYNCFEIVNGPIWVTCPSKSVR